MIVHPNRPKIVTPKDCGGFATLRDRLIDPETTTVLRGILAQTVMLLNGYGNGDWLVDGTGMSVNGEFRSRVDIKKRNTAKDPNGPLQIETRPRKIQEVLKSDTWRPLMRPEDWKRVVTISSRPYGWVGDVQVFERTTGERAALQPMLNRLVALDVRRDGRLFCDGGFNGAEYRDMAYKVGLIPWIPWPKNQKNGIAINADRSVIRHAAEIEAQFDLGWRNPEDRLRFIETYNIRSNAETLFSVWKREYPKIRVRTGAGPENEVLLMAVCHNVKRLLQLLSLAQKGRDFSIVA